MWLSELFFMTKQRFHAVMNFMTEKRNSQKWLFIIKIHSLKSFFMTLPVPEKGSVLADYTALIEGICAQRHCFVRKRPLPSCRHPRLEVEYRFCGS
jgi:hypothetical protein